MTTKLSVVLNTLNEGDLLPRVIASVKNLADEVVVVDMESDDDTQEVAKKLNAVVFTHKRLKYVEPARNFAVSKTTGDWVLVLDVDEEITPILAREIKDAIKGNKADYFRIPRKNMIFGHWMKYSRWWPDYNIRLFRKGSVSWNEIIHAVPMTQGRGMDFEDKEDLAIMHHHYDSIDKYLEHMNRYTSVQAELKIKGGYKFSWRDMLVRPAN
jgi:(heptosyl)LPS beta-1,4-glucosyltransferase